MDDEDVRSTDGSDNGSDLEDFLVGSDDEEMLKSDVDSEQDETAEATTLLDEFPYDKSLLQEDDTVGPRRSKRARRSVARYQDPDYLKLMLDDVDESDLKDDDDDKEVAENEDSDGEYALSAADDESDESEDDTE